LLSPIDPLTPTSSKLPYIPLLYLLNKQEMFQPTDLSLSPLKSLAGISSGVVPILTVKDIINGRDRVTSVVHSRPMTGLTRTRPRIITSMAEMGKPPRGVPAAKGASSWQNITAGTDNKTTKIKGTVVLMKKNVLDFNDLHASVLDRVHELLGRRVSLQLIGADNCDPGEFFFGYFFFILYWFLLLDHHGNDSHGGSKCTYTYNAG
jgi:hypothetical protein